MERLYAAPGLGALHWTEDELIDALVANPMLLNRPAVASEPVSGPVQPEFPPMTREL
jgi:arsenate reductase-like glutaredoxin family protein